MTAPDSRPVIPGTTVRVGDYITTDIPSVGPLLIVGYDASTHYAVQCVDRDGDDDALEVSSVIHSWRLATADEIAAVQWREPGGDDAEKCSVCGEPAGGNCYQGRTPHTPPIAHAPTEPPSDARDIPHTTEPPRRDWIEGKVWHESDAVSEDESALPLPPPRGVEVGDCFKHRSAPEDEDAFEVCKVDGDKVYFAPYSAHAWVALADLLNDRYGWTRCERVRDGEPAPPRLLADAEAECASLRADVQRWETLACQRAVTIERVARAAEAWRDAPDSDADGRAFVALCRAAGIEPGDVSKEAAEEAETEIDRLTFALGRLARERDEECRSLRGDLATADANMVRLVRERDGQAAEVARLKALLSPPVDVRNGGGRHV